MTQDQIEVREGSASTMDAGADRNASYRFDRFAVDAADERLLGPYGPIKLGNKAFRVLLLLIRKEGKLLTKDELFSSVWDGTTVTESALTSVIKELRRALGDHSRTPRFIESVYGRGYRFLCPVSAASDVAEEDSKGSASSAPAPTTGGRSGSTEPRPVPHPDGGHLEAQHFHAAAAAGDEAQNGRVTLRELRLPPHLEATVHGQNVGIRVRRKFGPGGHARGAEWGKPRNHRCDGKQAGSAYRPRKVCDRSRGRRDTNGEDRFSRLWYLCARPDYRVSNYWRLLNPQTCGRSRSWLSSRSFK